MNYNGDNKVDEYTLGVEIQNRLPHDHPGKFGLDERGRVGVACNRYQRGIHGTRWRAKLCVVVVGVVVGVAKQDIDPRAEKHIVGRDEPEEDEQLGTAGFDCFGDQIRVGV